MRVRLYGIDAPEKDQPYGEEAKRALVYLATRRQDGLMLDVMDVDQHNRLVGLVYYRKADARDSLNLRFVKGGYARWYRQFGGAEWGFPQAEKAARERRLRIWRKKGSVAPWIHRIGQKKARARGRRVRFRLRVLAFLAFLVLGPIELFLYWEWLSSIIVTIGDPVDFYFPGRVGS